MNGDDWAPTAPPTYIPHTWTHFDNSVNAVSFGFVATAILISMFLVMAIFEKILRAASSSSSSPPNPNPNPSSDAEAARGVGAFNLKLSYPSPKISGNAKEVSVVMPGDNIPTYIAHPAPVPCPPERIPWPMHHQHLPNLCSSSSL